MKVLAIEGPDGGLWVKDWKDGDFGIALTNPDPETSQEYTLEEGLGTTGPGQETIGTSGRDTLIAPFSDNKAMGRDGYDNLFANEGPGTQKFYGEGGGDYLNDNGVDTNVHHTNDVGRCL